jgi:hypothetical protein
MFIYEPCRRAQQIASQGANARRGPRPAKGERATDWESELADPAHERVTPATVVDPPDLVGIDP